MSDVTRMIVQRVEYLSQVGAEQDVSISSSVLLYIRSTLGTVNGCQEGLFQAED